jgi:hypothetical protein
VIDISLGGLAIEITHPRPAELMGEALIVEFPAFAEWAWVQLEGQIRGIAISPNGAVRIGIEFSPLSESERAAIDARSSVMA